MENKNILTILIDKINKKKEKAYEDFQKAAKDNLYKPSRKNRDTALREGERYNTLKEIIVDINILNKI